MQPTLVILAAGSGTRYGGLKQLAPIGPGGETLLEYSAFDARAAGFERVVLVIRREAEPAFRDRLDTGMARRLPVTYAHQRLSDLPAPFRRPAEREKPWGTGHAVLAAEAEIDGPFAVINADDFYGTDSYVALAGFLSVERKDNCLAAVGFRVDKTLTEAGPVSRALLDVDSSGHLRQIVEVLEVWRQDDRIVYRGENGHQRALAADDLVSMNMWGFNPNIFPALQQRLVEFLSVSGSEARAEFLLPDVVQSLVREERFRVSVLPGSDEWCGITFQQDFQRVQSTLSALVDQGRYPKELWT